MRKKVVWMEIKCEEKCGRWKSRRRLEVVYKEEREDAKPGAMEEGFLERESGWCRERERGGGLIFEEN